MSELQAVLGPSLTTIVEVTLPPDIAALVSECYGIGGTPERLRSERDELFRMTSDGRAEYIVRLTNPAEDPGVTEFQTEALVWLVRNDPQLPVPQLIRTTTGELCTTMTTRAGHLRTVRVMSYLNGIPLLNSRRSISQCRNIGAMLARVTVGLRNFSHPSASHELEWNLVHFSRLKRLLPARDYARWNLVRDCFEAFDTRVAPTIAQLPSQVVHNDFNLHNILVDPDTPDSITGILDFGDMVLAPRIFDVAVAASYHLDGATPIAKVAALVGAYHRVQPLSDKELDLLYDLIAARLAATATITEWRAVRQPENRDYILKNTQRAWDGLALLTVLSRTDILEQIHAACRTRAN